MSIENFDISKKPKNSPKQPEDFFAAPEIMQPVVEQVAGPVQTPEAPQRSAAKRSFRKSLILVPFMLLVLAVGSMLGSKFIKLASSVSVSTPDSAYKNISDTIGAVLGNIIPSLKDLDQSGLQDAIRGNRRVNILLLGYGGDGHQGSYLTDTIMVLSVDFSTNKAALISIPRDTWTMIPTNGDSGGFWKVNAAYALGLDDRDYTHKLPQYTGSAGGGNLAKYEASKIIGMPVDYFIAVDFSGFKKIVDDLGGVNIDVENSFTDYSYPEGDQSINGAWCIDDNVQTGSQQSVCRFKEVHFDAGFQFMNGERALEYARSRHAAGIEGSDFARGRRQQKLLAAIEQKALSVNAVPKVLQLIDDIQGHFTTDLSLAEIKDLSSYINKINLNNAAKISINDNGLLVSGTSADGQYILSPAAGSENFGPIQTYIFNALNGLNPTNAATNKNGKTTAGAAAN